MKRILVLFVALLFVFPVMAQEVTPEPAVVVVDDSAPLPAGSLFVGIGEILLFVFSIVLGGGATVMGVVYRLSRTPAMLAAIEQVGNSVPKDIAVLLIAALEKGTAIGELTIEALDGVPAANKPNYIEPEQG